MITVLLTDMPVASQATLAEYTPAYVAWLIVHWIAMLISSFAHNMTPHMIPYIVHLSLSSIRA
jgi:hypothetical protein